MNGFDLLFSLLSLPLGLAMAEILGDLGKVLDRRSTLEIGWLSPLLAALVLLDLSSFWLSAYGYRKVLIASDLTVLAVMAFASAYYLLATLVIPEDLEGVKDLDLHYWRNRRIVIGGIILLNLPNIPLTIAVGASAGSWSILCAAGRAFRGQWRADEYCFVAARHFDLLLGARLCFPGEWSGWSMTTCVRRAARP